ncbi:ATP-dependent RNA helicase [Elasticomyces elasticus]|nr:ATP-dependent RNA helicase [Elasticomyces elasticus]
MAQESKKRRLPPKISAMKSKKRQRVENGSRDQPILTGKPGKPARQVVRLDDLPWKEVEMPDRLDDFEGFFGLEEIDDVDVVRGPENGTVSYVATGKRAGELQRSHEQIKTADRPSADPEFDGGISDSASWSGFEDEVEENDRTKDFARVLDESTKSVDKPKGKNAHPRKEEPINKPLAQMSFAGLSDEELDDDVDTTAWQALKLSPETLSSLSRLKFANPTIIQQSAIPEILAGHDVVGKASTGSGKTLAFGIPILERYLQTKSQMSKPHKPEDDQKSPLGLILSPTRELAHQLDAHLTALCSSGGFEGPSIATLTGGLSLQKQQRLLKDADIVIGTPGRLWEVMSTGQGLIERLKKIQFLVVDEADRLLSEGHFKEVEEILNALDREDDRADAGDEHAEKEPQRQRQTLVFSATFHKGLQQKLAGKSSYSASLMDSKESMEYLLKKLNFREDKPKFIDVNPVSQMASGLKEGLVECAGEEKDLYLYALLLTHIKLRTLVFTNSIAAVRRLTPYLQNLNVSALALHSQMPQKARLRAIERFSGRNQPNSATTNAKSSGTAASVLVATDVAARGLDIPNVQLIIHYHMPRAADTYVHRSGRTARAGLNGSSILICAPEEVAGVRRLVAKVHASSAAANGAGKHGYFIRTLDIDRRLATRLKPRATLAKKLADAMLAKERKSSEDDFMRAAAEELGVDYDSEEFEREAIGRRGRGNGRKKKEKEARELTKAEVGALRAELRALLAKRVNVGVSERYLTAGGVDVDELMKGGTGEFLGSVQDIGIED